jgi:hypothetical protein
LIEERSKPQIMDFTEDEPEQVQYCKHCLDFNVRSPLKDRIYPDGQDEPDKENWRMCYECGSVYAVYELDNEATVKDTIETIENPHEFSKSEVLGVDPRRKKSRLEEEEDEYEDIKEPELRAELKRGSELISYFEEQIHNESER